jgi:hypothetical protein
VSGIGRINIDHDGLNAYGGELIVVAKQNVNISGNIIAAGGVYGGGGFVDILADGNVSLTGLIDIQAGEGGGGDLDIGALGNVTLGGEVIMDGGGDSGDAGIGDIIADGTITVNNLFRGRGGGDGANCGDGADFDLTTIGDVVFNAEVDLRGRGLDCAGGALTIDSRNVFLNNTVWLSGIGAEGEGGSCDIFAENAISLSGTVNVDGGLFGGGDVLFLADGNINISGLLNVTGRTINSPGALLVEIESGAALTVSGTIDASGGAASEGGDLSLFACDVTVTSAAVLASRGLSGSISVTASDTLSLAGRFDTDATGIIDIDWGPSADPPNLAGAIFDVPPMLQLRPLLAPCRLCETSAECSDGNPCTTDVCEPTVGCSNPPNTNSCSDNNQCTVGDVCSGGTCVPGAPRVCNDGNPCTTDACVPTSGCVAPPNSNPCNDGNACTTGDTCSGGSCTGAPIDCGDGNPCTDDVCTVGSCTNPNNDDPCDDGDACTDDDACSGGACASGSPTDCDDGDVCTTDSCDSLSGCGNEPILGCVDTDGDGKIDEEDECTTIDWTAAPLSPPNQNPRKFGLNLKKLSNPAGEQSILMKGIFNPGTPGFPIDPTVNGIHIYVEDAGGLLYDVSIPGGATGSSPCGPKDGWGTSGSASVPTWKYSNRSGAIPPGCAPGSAKGVVKAFVKDLRNTSKASLQLKIKAKDATLDETPILPITRLQADLTLAAQPAFGVASPEAIAGQCCEALFTGNPVSSRSPKPFCKVKLKGGVVDGVNCKGS